MIGCMASRWRKHGTISTRSPETATTQSSWSVPPSLVCFSNSSYPLGCIPEVDNSSRNSLVAALIALLALLAQLRSCSFPRQYTSILLSGLGISSCRVLLHRKIFRVPVVCGFTSRLGTARSRYVYAPIPARLFFNGQGSCLQASMGVSVRIFFQSHLYLTSIVVLASL